MPCDNEHQRKTRVEPKINSQKRWAKEKAPLLFGGMAISQDSTRGSEALYVSCHMLQIREGALEA